ncbi:hypothetical protein MNB_SV-9-1220 [hydrothermal vent metagenome]|uniref:Addiction module toxin RelE n=1 Tax=hydrothermal vent metagenome TaxID=652676 RepID=A0A1W1CC73_9ZZZZ
MNLKRFEFIELPTYLKSVKKLKKRFKNINSDVDSFFKEVNHIDDLGIKLHENIYKVRIKNSNKQAGKSSGYRLITYIKISENKINLLYIYDKSDLTNISDKELDRIVIDSYQNA